MPAAVHFWKEVDECLQTIQQRTGRSSRNSATSILLSLAARGDVLALREISSPRGLVFCGRWCEQAALFFAKKPNKIPLILGMRMKARIWWSSWLMIQPSRNRMSFVDVRAAGSRTSCCWKQGPYSRFGNNRLHEPTAEFRQLTLCAKLALTLAVEWARSRSYKLLVMIREVVNPVDCVGDKSRQHTF